jgi:hypothetical protein
MGSREANGKGYLESQERVMSVHGCSGDENLKVGLASLLTRTAADGRPESRVGCISS